MKMKYLIKLILIINKYNNFYNIKLILKIIYKKKILYWYFINL